jgi:cystathionine beta-lyase
MADVCIRHHVVIFSDEIHSDLILKGFSHTPTAALSGGAAAQVIAAYSPSKTFNLAGLRASAVVIPDEKLRAAYRRRIDADEAGAVNLFGTVGLIAAYRHGEEYLRQLLAYIEGNVDYVGKFVGANLKGVRLVRPEGTYLLWMDFNETGKSADEIDRLVIENAKVAGDLGRWFGEAGAGFIRLNAACPRDTVREAMRRLESVFGK